MKNYIQRGDVYSYLIPDASPATQIASGDIVEIGDVLVGVAASSGESGDTIAVNLEGVYTLPKDSSTISIGAQLYSDGSGNVTTDANGGNNKLIGVAWTAALTGDAEVEVLLG